MKKDLSFSKEEKLKSRKMIGEIFEKGHVVKAYPIRIQFLFHDMEDLAPCQVGVSVPKRKFKRAVDRNRIKRQLREVYRLNKSNFVDQLEKKEKKIAMMIIFTASKACDYHDIEKAVKASLSKIRI